MAAVRAAEDLEEEEAPEGAVSAEVRVPAAEVSAEVRVPADSARAAHTARMAHMARTARIFIGRFSAGGIIVPIGAAVAAAWEV